MKKQTAVEWLVDQIWKREPLEHEKKVIEQAKEMEKQQRISDYYQGACDESDNHGAQYICESNAENWYNEQKQ